MLVKTVVILMLLGILVSLGSAAVFLLRRQNQTGNVARALTWRVGLSITLFVLLMAGFYFGVITPHGLAPR